MEVKENGHVCDENCGHGHHGRRHGLVGIILIVIGLIWLLNNLGVLTPYEVSVTWPVALIIIGGASIISRRCRGC